MSFLRKASDPHTTPSVFPTFLIPSTPFRRKSRQSSADSVSSNASAASATSSAPSTVSSNPFSRCPTPVPVPVQDDEIIAPTDRVIGGHSSHIHCAKCSTDLCLTSQIISKGFTGRHGRAYLVQGGLVPGRGLHVHSAVLPNTYLGKSVPRNLVTGQHTVSDVSCAICGSLLGWKYVEASEESQKYKVGKFILETKKIRIGVSWECGDDYDDDGGAYEEIIPLPPNELRKMTDGGLGSGGGGGGGGGNGSGGGGGGGSRGRSTTGALDPVEFDSQDEDECEDLFAGVWSPQLASKRRLRKKERMGRRAAKLAIRPNQSQDSLG